MLHPFSTDLQLSSRINSVQSGQGKATSFGLKSLSRWEEVGSVDGSDTSFMQCGHTRDSASVGRFSNLGELANAIPHQPSSASPTQLASLVQ
jgi:hypothetical protein